MKKALITLAVSLLILITLLGVDLAKCDGNVLLKPLLGIETSTDYTDGSDYSNVFADSTAADAPKKQKYADKKLTVTAPKLNETVSETTVEEASGTDMPEEVEISGVADSERGYEFYFPLLSEEETSILHRGRNASATHVPKGASAIEYRKATGIEALFGWLYLEGRNERIRELFTVISEQIAREENDSHE